MSNVLHNTPAKKLHQTLTMIYPSIKYPWSIPLVEIKLKGYKIINQRFNIIRYNHE